MASIRQLPSGRWQASVLLDDGRRTTATRDSMDGAAAWAVDTEAERDELRRAVAGRNQKARGDFLLNELDVLVDRDALSKTQRRRLVEIAGRLHRA